MRRVLGGAGVLVVAVAVLASGAVAGTFALDPLVALLGNDYFLIAVLAVAVLVVAAVVVAHGDGVDQASVPDPETAVTVPTPGDDLASTLDRPLLAVPLVGRATTADVRTRLRETAVEALRRSRGTSESAARDRVASGTWTDDEVAAAFLAEGARLPAEVWLRAAVARETGFARGARRTAREIARLHERGPADATGDGGVYG